MEGLAGLNKGSINGMMEEIFGRREGERKEGKD